MPEDEVAEEDIPSPSAGSLGPALVLETPLATGSGAEVVAFVAFKKEMSWMDKSS